MTMAATTSNDNASEKKKRVGGKGKQKIEIKKIEKYSKRHVTFSKRKKGLFKKAQELCSLTNGQAQAAVLVFSEAGNLYSSGSPSVDQVLDRYLNFNSNSHDQEVYVKPVSNKYWWDYINETEIQGMGLQELEELKVSLLGLRNQVVSKLLNINDHHHQQHNEMFINGGDNDDNKPIPDVCQDDQDLGLGLDLNSMDWSQVAESLDLGYSNNTTISGESCVVEQTEYVPPLPFFEADHPSALLDFLLS